MNNRDRKALQEDPPKLSPQRWVITVDRLDCCIQCVRRSKSRWGKHPHTKPKKTSK